jgi:predicted dinucleotide-binding enzyme
MRLGIIGAGNVGRALGAAWLRVGHDVRFGVPDASDAKYADLAPRVTNSVEAAQTAEVIVLATPWPATQGAVRGLGDLAGKIVIDCTNPLSMAADGADAHARVRYIRWGDGRLLGSRRIGLQDVEPNRCRKHGANA